MVDRSYEFLITIKFLSGGYYSVSKFDTLNTMNHHSVCLRDTRASDIEGKLLTLVNCMRQTETSPLDLRRGTLPTSCW